MKQFILLMAMLALGTMGSFYDAYWGLLLYYTLAVLRPQYLWDWALPADWRWSLMAAGAVFLGLFINLPRLAARARLNTVAAFMIVYAVLVLLSMLNALNTSVAQTWGLEFGKIVLIALVASLLIDSVWQIKLLGIMVVVTLGYVAWDVNFRYFFQGRLDIYHSGLGGLDNNGAGLMLAMGIPFAYAFAVSSKRWFVRAGCWAVALLMVHAMLMSYSRGAMVSAIAGAAWLVAHHRPRRHALLIVAVICLIVPLLAGKEIQSRFFSTSNVEADPSINSRFESWSAAWAIAWDHPLTGEGMRNSNRFTQNYGADVAGRTVHNQYLQIGADSGIPAMAAYTLMILAAFWTLSRACRACAAVRDQSLEAGDPDGVADRAERLRYLLLGFQASLLVFAFGSTFLSLEVFELPWLLVVIAGVVPAVVDRELARGHGPRTPAPAGVSNRPRRGPAVAGLVRRPDYPPPVARI